MCGISGFFGFTGTDTEAITRLNRMGHSIAHRGPDNMGVWFDQRSRVGFTHRRLSILDVSEAGNQPMTSKSGRFKIVFNGEIYNHREIRKSLESICNPRPIWAGTSDTETILLGFDVFGIESFLQQLVGMFAIAVWDFQKETLTLIRDRIGEKPIYYGCQKRVITFGSETKAIKASGNFDLQIKKSALQQFFSSGYVQTPNSIYTDLYKLPPGTYLSISRSDIEANSLPAPIEYWSLTKTTHASRNKFAGTIVDAKEELKCLLENSIRGQLESDVPIGAFLSGGIDSSLIVAIMQKLSKKKICTFSIGFEAKTFDESEHATAVASILGTTHEVKILSEKQIINSLTDLSFGLDEPFADPSLVATKLLANFARQKVKVALSGDGADEIFGGYSRYKNASLVQKIFSEIPKPLRVQSSKIFSKISSSSGLKIISKSATQSPFLGQNLSRKLRAIAEILESDFESSLYYANHNYFQIQSLRKLLPFTEIQYENENRNFDSLNALISWMMIQDGTSYLPDDILVKLDRAAMFESLETRTPFLDHRIVEYAASLPLEFKVTSNSTKIILREMLKDYYPKSLFKRPKMGFNIPLVDWLRGGLRHWAQNLLDKISKEQDELIDGKFALEIWKKFLSGDDSLVREVWTLVVYRSWYEQQ